MMDTRIGSLRLALTFLVLCALTSLSFGQKVRMTKSIPNIVDQPAASVAPVFFNSVNITCAKLNGSPDPAFSHIVKNDSVTLTGSALNGVHNFTDGTGRVVDGAEDATVQFSIASSASAVTSWTSQWAITAVILRYAGGSWAYPYKPYGTSDTDLNPGEPGSIVSVVFCYDNVGSTAGDGAISGRVVDSNGLGISKAQLILINGNTGEARIVMTNPFGFYNFGGLDVNELYILNVSHKRYSFPEKQRVVSLDDSLTDVNFMADPRE
ncbi:MAG: carboxypeptidase-like regulatory domain-containing protein [Pyrinomonadaceae bacterium]